jgi:signal peptidase I
MDVQTDLRDAVKRNLVADVVGSFGQVRLEVTGTSMLPAVWPGDIVTVSRCHAADLCPGQIVLCFRDEALVTHRLVGKIGNRFITRGDSVCHYDAPLREDEILGQVVSILRDGRRIDLSPAWWHGAGRFILRRSQLVVRVLLGVNRRLSPPTLAAKAAAKVGHPQLPLVAKEQ